LHLYGVGSLVRTRLPRADSGALCLAWPPRPLFPRPSPRGAALPLLRRLSSKLP